MNDFQQQQAGWEWTAQLEEEHELQNSYEAFLKSHEDCINEHLVFLQSIPSHDDYDERDAA